MKKYIYLPCHSKAVYIIFLSLCPFFLLLPEDFLFLLILHVQFFQAFKKKKSEMSPHFFIKAVKELFTEFHLLESFDWASLNLYYCKIDLEILLGFWVIWWNCSTGLKISLLLDSWSKRKKFSHDHQNEDFLVNFTEGVVSLHFCCVLFTRTGLYSALDWSQ